MIGSVTPEARPNDIGTLQTALAAERAARQQAEARASGAEAMVAYLKLLIAKMKRERFGQSAERGRKLLDQLELQLEELEASAAEDELAASASASWCRRRLAVRAAAAGLLNSARTLPRPSRSCRGNGR